MDNMSLIDALKFLEKEENEEISKKVATIVISLPIKDLEEIMKSLHFDHHNQNHHN